MTAVSAWESWAPPLSPPVESGLPYHEAALIAAAWWDADPHLCAALQWEHYAATLPPELPVSMVTTGSQSISYGRPTPGGAAGVAMAQAEWHRSLAATNTASVPVTRARAGPRRYRPAASRDRWLGARSRG